MDNLHKQLTELFNTSEQRNYYGLENLPNPFDSLDYNDSKQFIRIFLEYSEKLKDIYNVLDQIEPYRNLHIVTNYFLGILIYENSSRIKTCIDNEVKRLNSLGKNSFDNSFKYFWFLICFYHDVGYYFENNTTSIKSLKTLQRDVNISHKLPGLLGVPKLFRSVKNKYLKYRFQECNRYDHGIVGGMLFYDRLIKIYEYYHDIYGQGQDDFNHNNLHWSASMYKYFQLIASVILVHNIWFLNENVDSPERLNTYRYYKLDQLIISDSSRKITLNRHPLLFLLSLVDSIEPTKRFGINFLKEIRIIFPQKGSIIIAKNCRPDPNVDKWFQDINSIQNWLKIDTNIINNSHIEILY
jgi:hypothetical protein